MNISNNTSKIRGYPNLHFRLNINIFHVKNTNKLEPIIKSQDHSNISKHTGKNIPQI